MADDLRLTTEDDLREDLQLAAMELMRRFKFSPARVRRSVNDAVKAHEAGERGTPFLERLWNRGAA
jgi:hypothetical protein